MTFTGKFKKGEIAILKLLSSNAADYPAGKYEVEVVSTNALNLIEGEGYLIDFPLKRNPNHPQGFWFATEEELEKRPPPPELSSWPAIEAVTRWNPCKNREGA